MWPAVRVPLARARSTNMTTTQRTQPLLLAVDGNSLVHRAYHAMERTGLRGPDGRPTWATKGFCSLLLAACERYGPDALIVGFDDTHDAVRKQMYPQYKANRSAKAPELYQQMDDIAAMLRAMGIAVVVPARLEADDVLASAASKATAAGWRTIVVTSDRDSFALVNETTAVLRVLNGGIADSPLVTRHTLAQHANCGVGQYTDYAALRGDPSDNLPGARGIGEKTAGTLLASFATVRAAWAAYDKDAASVESVIGKSAATKLVADEARANVERNLAMMAMHTDVPLPDLDQARLPVAREGVEAALAERGLATVHRAAMTHWCRLDMTPVVPAHQAQAELDIPLPDGPSDDHGPRDHGPEDGAAANLGTSGYAPDPAYATLSAVRPQVAEMLTTAGYVSAPPAPAQWSLTL